MHRLTILLLIVLLSACAGAPSEPTRTPDDVIAAFQAAGLEAVDPRPMTPDDYGAAPLVGAGVRFLIPSTCPDCGGRLIAVQDPDQLAGLRTYYEDLGASSALFFSWVFVQDGLLLQINGDLPEAQARQYEAVLRAP